MEFKYYSLGLRMPGILRSRNRNFNSGPSPGNPHNRTRNKPKQPKDRFCDLSLFALWSMRAETPYCSMNSLPVRVTPVDDEAGDRTSRNRQFRTNAVTFFRQSGWIMMATGVNGLFMYAVHKFASRMPKGEYGVFATLLQVITLTGIPAVGLQGLTASLASMAVDSERIAILTGTLRRLLGLTFALWLLAAIGSCLFGSRLFAALHIGRPLTWELTLLIGLASLWRPILMGVLQGNQDFAWFGWAKMSEGVSRFIAVCVVVGGFGGYAPGAMGAVLFGMLVSLFACGWPLRRHFSGPATAIRYSEIVRLAGPLTIGLGVGIFMMSADMIFVQAYFPKEQTAYYAAAGMIGRALIFITSTFNVVMFPKVARGAALGKNSDARWHAVVACALCGAIGASACTLFPSAPLHLLYDNSFVEHSSPLVSWFTWCVLPLTLANLLINDLMARSQFRVLPWLLGIAIAYGATLWFYHRSFLEIIRILGIYSLLFFFVAGWFAWKPSKKLD